MFYTLEIQERSIEAEPQLNHLYASYNGVELPLNVGSGRYRSRFCITLSGYGGCRKLITPFLPGLFALITLEC